MSDQGDLPSAGDANRPLKKRKRPELISLLSSSDEDSDDGVIEEVHTDFNPLFQPPRSSITNTGVQPRSMVPNNISEVKIKIEPDEDYVPESYLPEMEVAVSGKNRIESNIQMLDSDSENDSSIRSDQPKNPGVSFGVSSSEDVIDLLSDSDESSADDNMKIQNTGSPQRLSINSRHLSGRQRRLEAVRWRNCGSEGNPDEESDSDEIDDAYDVDFESLLISQKNHFRERDPNANNSFAQLGTARSDRRPNEKATSDPEITKAAIDKQEKGDNEKNDSNGTRVDEKLVNKESENNVPKATEPGHDQPKNGIRSIKVIDATSTTKGRKMTAKKSSRKRITSKKSSSSVGARIMASSDFDDLYMNGKDFILWAGITSPKDFLDRGKSLESKVNDWRNERNEFPLSDPAYFLKTLRYEVRDILQSLVSKPKSHENPRVRSPGGKNRKKPKPTYVMDENTEEEEEIDFSNCMTVVPSLSKRFLNRETGLPVYQFAVFNSLSKDIIYEFRVEAKPSWIANAGNGAFLTYLGAREARSPSSAPSEDVEVIHPLVSRDSDGYHMNVRVVGEHIQGGEDDSHSQYPPPVSQPSIHESPEILAVDGANMYPWDTGTEGSRLVENYVENPERVFCTSDKGCSVIELGRYGPFWRSDRKIQLHYELKNFVFSNVPSEWGFDICEDLKGEDQVADVTDDATGMPHHVARQNICMYVNETGGDPGLKQTVWSGQVMNREVNYFFKTGKPLKKGETIELLISYFGTYDEIRERKGYGKRNKTGEARSDDHFPSFLERNFIERYDMVEVLYEVDEVMNLYRLSEFLEGIRRKLCDIIERFLQDVQSSTADISIPFAQQIVALRRLNWLKPFFLNKIESLKWDVKNSSNGVLSAFYGSILKQCISNTNSLDWSLWPTLMNTLDTHPGLVDKTGINVREKFREEVTEDICYGVKATLLCPCNESIWCGMAAELTRNLCYEIARFRWNYSNQTPATNLCQTLLRMAMEASEALPNLESLDDLKFDTEIWKRYALNDRGNIAREPRGTQCIMTLSIGCSGPENRLPAPFILKGNEVTKTVLGTIHKPWYLTRQIVFLVDIFAQTYLVEEESYSLDILCQKAGITRQMAALFLKRPIELDLDSNLFFGQDFASIYSKGNNLQNVRKEKRVQNSMGVAKKKKPRTSAGKLLFWKVLVEGLQKLKWTVENGNRPNDFYIMPPGVARGKGFKQRVDFFDSALLVMKCLESDKRYCTNPEIISLLKEYRGCQEQWERIKTSKSKELKTLSSAEVVDYLKKLGSGNQPGKADEENTKRATATSHDHKHVKKPASGNQSRKTAEENTKRVATASHDHKHLKKSGSGNQSGKTGEENTKRATATSHDHKHMKKSASTNQSGKKDEGKTRRVGATSRDHKHLKKFVNGNQSGKTEGEKTQRVTATSHDHKHLKKFVNGNQSGKAEGKTKRVTATSRDQKHLQKFANENQSGKTKGEKTTRVMATFDDQKLGLSLATVEGAVTVKGVTSPVHMGRIKARDVLVAVGDREVKKKTLKDVCSYITGLERPVTLTFERKTQPPGGAEKSSQT